MPLSLIKWTNYEYWPWWFFYLPILPYWLWLSLKTRSLTFFTATNTNIELGGFFGESKIAILNQISPEWLPNTFPVRSHQSYEQIQSFIEEHKIMFPFIVKPNIGERGFNVEKMNTALEFRKYHSLATYDYIIQEFVDYPIELGVLYHRLPDDKKGYVTSVTIKEFLTVTGDGQSSILELMNKNTRSRFQIKSMKGKLGEGIHEILHKNETRLLEPIGNHCRGTRFINGNHLINDRLHLVFNTISNKMNGFYYGRFDLKVKSIEDLYNGKNIKIMELNGASSEPGHIYDSSVGIVNAYKDLAFHWRLLAQIAIQNKRKGIQPVSFKLIATTFLSHFGKKNTE